MAIITFLAVLEENDWTRIWFLSNFWYPDPVSDPVSRPLSWARSRFRVMDPDPYQDPDPEWEIPSPILSRIPDLISIINHDPIPIPNPIRIPIPSENLESDPDDPDPDHGSDPDPDPE